MTFVIKLLGFLWGLSATLVAGAQTGNAPRLPQDIPRAPEPAPRELPLIIDRDRYAEQTPAGAADATLHLTAIDLDGNSTLATAQLEPLWHDMLGHDVPLSALFGVAARISATYRAAGYVLSQAIVPRQEIAQTEGRVRIRVAEGYISRITLAPGLAGGEQIERMLAPLTAERPLTLSTLERRLLLLNDLPGVRAQASLRAAREENAAELELVVERDAQVYSISGSNRAPVALGPLQLEVSAERRGVIGAFDRHLLRWVGSGNDRLNLLAYSGDVPVGDDGGLVSWSASASRSNPKSGEVFNLDTRSESYSLGGSYPVIRSRDANLTLRGTFAAYNGKSDIAQGTPLSQERLRSLRLGVSVDRTDALGGVNLLDVEVAKGLSGLGATRKDDPLLARLGANPQFTKLALYVARLQSLGGEFSALLSATAQQSSDMLTSSEQFSLGGDLFLRAYDASELLGDKGRAGKLELRYNLAAGPLLSTVYAYYEGGSVQLHNIDGSTSTASALSGGLGIRVSGRYGIKGYLEVAKPRHRAIARYGDERARLLAGLGIDF